MSFLTTKRVAERKERRSTKGRSPQGRRLLIEPLEARALLSLLGVSPIYPIATYASNGTINYHADAQVLSFAVDATPMLFRQSSATPYRTIAPPRDFLIQVNVDNQGHLIANPSASDLTVIGDLDIDGDGTVDYSGTLLTGKATQFGYYDSGTTSDKYDFRFTPTGGALASFYAGTDIGITTTSDGSTFEGTFTSDFSGLAKGILGAIPTLWSSLSGYVYDDGANNDGIKQTGEVGIPGVSVTLTGTDIAGNAVLINTVTDSLGAYSFTQLRPGTYTVTETQPGGWLDGKDTQGTPGTGVTGNDVFTNIVLDAGVNGQDNNFGELLAQPGIGIVKLTNGSDNNSPTGPLVPVGSTVTWTYEVTNYGNVPLNNVALNDDQGVVPVYQSGDAGTLGQLDPGETWIYEATGIAIAGQYTNIGSVTANDATGTTEAQLSDSDPDNYFGVQPVIGIVKLTNGTDNNSPTGPLVPVGSTVTWTYEVTNYGNVPLNNVALSDDQGVVPVYQSGDAGTLGQLDPGETWIYQATGIAIAGQYTNVGSVTANDATGTTEAQLSDSDPDNYFGVQPVIGIVKLTNGTDNNSPTGPLVPVGSTVTWTYEVTNYGNVPLNNVALSDDQGVVPVYQSGDAGTLGQLDPGETWIYQVTGIAIAGQYTNIGSVTANDATGTTEAQLSDSDPDNYFGVQPVIGIVKLTNGTDNNSPTGPLVPVGSTVTWTYEVTNYGNVPLNNVALSDDQGVVPVYQSGDAGTLGQLDPGETWIYEATGIAIAGQYTNVGSVTANDATGTTEAQLSDSDPDNYFGVQPVIGIVKLTNGTDNNSPTGPLVPVGSTVTWTYEVTNYGNVPLNNVALSDDQGVVPVYQSGDFGTLGQLDPGETWIYQATGIAIAGQYTNVGSVTANDATGTTEAQLSDSDPDNYFGVQPVIGIVKLTNGTDNNSPTGPLVPVGSTVTWTYEVTNYGNVPLNNVALSDDQGVVPVYQSGDAGTLGQLDLGETWIYQATGIAIAGQYTNVGTVTADDATGTTEAQLSDSDPDNYFGVQPVIGIVKLTNGTDNNSPTGPLVPVGSTVTWTYEVTNYGNVPLNNVALSDDQGVTPVYQSGDFGTLGQLDPGETWIYQATGIAIAGQYTNVGSVTANDATGTTEAQLSDSDPDNYFGVQPDIGIVKLTNGTDNNSPTGPLVQVGSTVTWTYAVTNYGNVPLNNVALSDDQGVVPVYQSGDAGTLGQLDPGETWIYQTTGTAIVGQYTNVGTVTANDATGTTEAQLSDSDPDNYFGVQPGIGIVKLTNGTDNNSPTGPLVPVGSTVTWTYAVTNYGNVPLNNVALSDDQGAVPVYQSGDAGTLGELDPGETWIYQATGIAIAGQYTNVGSVTANDATGTTEAQLSDSDPDNYFGVQPDIGIVKLTNGTDNNSPTGPLVQVGSTVTWTYAVTNYGNVPLNNVALSDDQGVVPVYQSGDAGTLGQLDPGETWIYQTTGTAIVGQYTNVGTVTANDATGTIEAQLSDSDPDNYFGLPQVIVIAPDKRPGSRQEVQVIDKITGNVLSHFMPYEAKFLGGVRVTTADLTGDGIDEIITAPGRGRAGQIRVFAQDGTPLTQFWTMAYPKTYTGGVTVAVGDVNGDGRNDLVTIPSYGAANVRVFLGQDGTDPIANTPWKSFLAFPSSYIGGGVVAVADMGHRSGGVFTNYLDGRAEIIVGSGGATKASVTLYDLVGRTTAVRKIHPFCTSTMAFNGGVFLSVARLNADSIPDLVIGAGSLGGSKVETWTWNTANATLKRLTSFTAFADCASKQAPTRVTTLDVTGDGVADTIVAIQGPEGKTGQIRSFNINGLSPYSVAQSPMLAGFAGPHFAASITNVLPTLFDDLDGVIGSLINGRLEPNTQVAPTAREVDALFAAGVFD